MKLVAFRSEGTETLGIVDADQGTVQAIETPKCEDPLRELIAGWDRGRGPTAVGEPLPLATVRLAPPLPRTGRNIICVGKNYHDHSREFARSGFDASDAPAAPDRPIFFTKPRSAVIGPGEPIDPHPGVTEAVDYEAELAVIIGRGGKAIPEERALDHVWGCTIVNDVTARDLQRDHRQWFLGKSLDTFCPAGPWAVSADELDLSDLTVECRVNGELRQRAGTKDLIFAIPTLIATLSAGTALLPGDVIATGTPAGVGIGFTPPRYLKPGDEVSVRITGLGTLTNPVGGPAEPDRTGHHHHDGGRS